MPIPKIIKTSAPVYLVGTLVQKAIPFFMLFVYTRLLAPSEYGMIGVFLSILGLFSVYIGLRPEVYLIRNYQNLSIAEFKSDLTVAWFLLVIFTVIMAPLLLLFVFVFFKNEVPVLTISLLVLMVAVAQNGQLISDSVLQANGNAKAFVLVQLVGAGSGVLIALPLVLGFATWEAKVSGELAGFIIAAVLSFILASKIVKLDWRTLTKRNVNAALRFLFPLTFHVISLVVMNLIDRLLLLKFTDAGTVGLYSVAYMLGMTVGVVHEAFLRSWNPYFYHEVQKNKKCESLAFGNAIKYCAVSILLGLITASFFYLSLGFILPDKYQGIESVIYVVIAAYSLEGMRKVFCGYLYVSNKTKTLAVITFVGAGLNILLNIVMIPAWGMLGAAYATLISFFVITFLVIAVSVQARSEYIKKHYSEG